MLSDERNLTIPKSMHEPLQSPNHCMRREDDAPAPMSHGDIAFGDG